MNGDWTDKVKEFCEKYNIPLFYLADTLYEPKVVPMIRGKAFEFSAMIALQQVLSEKEWIVDKTPMNAQIGFHDIDVRVVHKATKKAIRVECKLSKKGGYRQYSDGHSEIRVKCMRSRTLGPSKVRELAPKLGIDQKSLSIHNDQYLPADFDVVITTIGNAFYRTDPKTGKFEWRPTTREEEFLRKISLRGSQNIKDVAFSTLFVARTSDLTISHSSRVVCTRAKCKNKQNCGFIPNYPIISFDSQTNKPNNGWVPLENALSVYESFLK